MNELLAFSLLMITSFGLALLVNRLGVPRISSYVVVGILFSKGLLGDLLGVPHMHFGDTFTTIALGIIAFLVGVELEWRKIGDLGKPIVFITIGQILGAIVVVSTGLVALSKIGWLNLTGPVPFILGAIAATTAPGGTLGVIDEYDARGTLTTILLGVVILDDALGIIFFEFITGLISEGSFGFNLAAPLFDIFSGLGFGAILGAILGYATRFFTQEELRFPLFIGFILLCTAAAHVFHFSSLLACMTLGMITQIVSNQEAKCLILPIKHIEEFIFIAFFLFAGLHFDSRALSNGLGLLAAYIALRAIGKYSGAWIGGWFSRCRPQIRNLSGLGLLPQAGVAIGLALSLDTREHLSPTMSVVFNTILGSTVFYEIAGPILTRYSLQRAGDIKVATH